MRTVARCLGFPLAFILFPAGLALAQPPAAAPGAEIRGRVLDSESRSPVPQAEIVVVGTSLRTYSDDDGRFLLEDVPPGTYEVSVVRLGYKPLLQANVEVRSGVPLVLELSLKRSSIPLAEVTVTPGSFSFMGKGPATQQTMTREDIAAVPQIGEDIFRAVNRLPGLSSNDYAAHFGIRGGRHDETLILLDGMELYEPYHLKDFNEGAISIIDAETIDGVELMTGGFPAQYGNKRSGVFDITSRTPETDRARYDLGVSFLNSRAMARGPLWNGRGSWLAFARGGYMDLMFQLIDQGDLPSPQYEDAFGKLSLDLTPKHTLVFDVLHAGDRYTYDIAATTGFQDTFQTRENASNYYFNSYVGTTLKSTLGPRTSVRSMVSATFVAREREGAERFVTQATPAYTLFNKRNYWHWGLKQDWTLGLSDRDILSFGTDFRQLRNRDAFQGVAYQDPNDPSPDPGGFYPVTTSTRIDKRGSRLGAYVSNRWRVIEPLVLETGVRYDGASYTGDDDLSPRTSAALSLGGGTTLRLGWGHYRQIQGIEEVTALDSGNRFFRSELSEQWTAGLERLAGNGTVLRIEGYWKRGSDLRPVFRNWKGAVDAFPEPNEDRILVFPKTNTAHGVELYFDRRFGERISARASYAYSVAEEEVSRIDNVNVPDPLPFDVTHPIPQDQRHAANVDFTYRPAPHWSFNGSFAYHSGWPATLEIPVRINETDPDETPASRPVKLYGDRLPDYLRFDVRASRKWTTSLGDFSLALEVINLTNNSNIFGYDYFLVRDPLGNLVLERGDETWFSIMPSIGIAWSSRF